eukprot:gene39398-biopygen78289
MRPVLLTGVLCPSSLISFASVDRRRAASACSSALSSASRCSDLPSALLVPRTCCPLPGNWDVLAPYATGKTSDPATFNPVKLNTTQWMESITALGANIAILTAKHGCGFTLWPTKAVLPDGSPYGYSVGTPRAAIQRDVLREFVDSADAAGVGVAKEFASPGPDSVPHHCVGDTGVPAAWGCSRVIRSPRRLGLQPRHQVPEVLC